MNQVNPLTEQLFFFSLKKKKKSVSIQVFKFVFASFCYYFINFFLKKYIDSFSSGILIPVDYNNGALEWKRERENVFIENSNYKKKNKKISHSCCAVF